MDVEMEIMLEELFAMTSFNIAQLGHPWPRVNTSKSHVQLLFDPKGRYLPSELAAA